MLRTALRPANLALLALVLAAAALFSLLGQWQLGRSEQHARVSPTESVVPLGDVLQPASDFTGHADHQRVSASGTWADQPLEVVGGRDLGGRSGRWVVAALAVDGTGALLPVALGWQPDGSGLPAAPTGSADLLGRLQVGEDPQGLDADGGLRTLSSADLVNLWPGTLYTGYLVADPGTAGLSAVGGGAGGALTALPSPAPTPQLDLQNLSYAFQWWLFAVFAVVFWGKVVRDRHHDEAADRTCEELERQERARERALSATWEDAHVPDSPARAGAPVTADAPDRRGVRP